MHRIVLSLGLGDVGQPLSSQTGPLESMCHDQVIEERSVLFPDLVLLVDDSLLNCLIIDCSKQTHL